MKTMVKIVIVMLTSVLMYSCSTTSAATWRNPAYERKVKVKKHRPRGKAWGYYKKDGRARYNMLMSYLNRHRHITVQKYCKLTGLPYHLAEAELNGWTNGRNRMLQIQIKGRKKMYIRIR